MIKNYSMKLVAILATGLIALVVGTFAQSAVTGAINGKVTDPQGAVVPNASLTVTNIATNQAVTVNASDDGTYKVTNLQPGTYTIATTVSGFAPAKAERIIVEVGKTTTVDIPLSVGGQSVQVDVTAEAPVVNTNDNANATNIDQTQISELPINGRRASDFARLTPGVNPEGDFGLNSFRGLSSLLNNHTLDGTDNNNMFFSEERGRTRIQYAVSQAAVREFQVNNTNFSAEYGRAAGGVINTVTKSGTNDFRGELFFFDRDNRWGSRNPSALLPTASGALVAVKPKDARYQFGGAIGGPIVKDKLFFFFTYDQQNRDFPGTATPGGSNSAAAANAFNPITVATNPTTCNNSNAAGNTLCLRGITQAQSDASLTFLRSLTGIAPRKQDQRIFFPKVDWVINGRNSLTVSYNRVRTTGINAFQTPAVVNVGLADFGNDFVGIDTFNARLASTISSRVVNEFRFQEGRENARSILETETASESALAGLGTTINGLLPSVSFAAAANFTFQFGTSTNFQRAAFPDERTTQFVDTITASLGNHTVKTGFDIKFTKDFISNLRSEYGSYSYNNVQDFISDYTSAVNHLTPRCSGGTPVHAVGCYSTYTQAFGLRDYTLKTPDYAFFVQDDWRVNHRLTLNLGLRWDYQQFPDAQFPNNFTPVLNTNTATVPQRYTQAQANEIIARTGQIPSDKNNFGPRVGFAWDIAGNGKTVLRGGWGLYYGRVPNTFLSSAITNTGGIGSQLSAQSIRPTDAPLTDTSGNPINVPLFPSVLSATPARTSAALSITTIAPNFQNPQVNEVDLIFEREITKNTVVAASYLFTHADHLPAFIDLNLPLPATTKTYVISGGPENGRTFTVPFYLSMSTASGQARPITNFASIIDMESVSKSNYNALVLQIQRRMTKGLSGQANYTWSKATDYNQQFGTFAASFMNVNDPLNPALDRGPSSNNIPHKFVGSAVWIPATTFNMAKSGLAHAIFGDLQLSPIVVISSGYAVTSTIPSTFPPSFSTPSNTLTGAGGLLTVPLARNIHNRPYTFTTDLRVSKRIHFTEHMSLELLAEGFNIFNRSNITQVNTSYISSINFGATSALGVLTYNPDFGKTTTTGINNTIIFSPRQIQLGARFHF